MGEEKVNALGIQNQSSLHTVDICGCKLEKKVFRRRLFREFYVLLLEFMKLRIQISYIYVFIVGI